MAKLFRLESESGTVVYINPDSIIRITQIRNTNSLNKSEIEMRHAMVCSVYDMRKSDELAKQINDECYK